MRWSIVRLIWFRELRDQLRDRRTLFMIAVLPLLLYPALGFAALQFVVGFADRTSVIGVVSPQGSTDFPPLPGDAKPDHIPLIRDGQIAMPDLRLAGFLPREQILPETRKRLKIVFLPDDSRAPL